MQHGGDLTDARARYGGGLDGWLDLSTGINPYAWPLPAIPDAAWRRLPGRAELDGLLDAARRAYGVPGGAGIVAAPGTQALIQWLPRLAGPGGVAVLGPTYAEHAESWRLAGREVHDLLLLPPGEGRDEGLGRALVNDPDLPRPLTPTLSRGERGKQACHAVVVNPNNPDGRVLTHRALARLAETADQRHGWLVVDESFADTDPSVSAASLVQNHPIIVLRSFGKFYGLAGVRLGFAIAAAPIVQRIAEALGPWAVPGPAIAIGTQALHDAGWAAAMRAQLVREAQALDTVLARTFEPAGGTTLYRLVRHRRARFIHERLSQQRIWVRRFDWADDLLRFGLPGNGLDRLEAALASC